MTAQEKLSEMVNYGGGWMTRAQVYAEFRKSGYDAQCAAMWLAGYDRTH